MTKKSKAILFSSSALLGFAVVVFLQRDRPDHQLETQVFPLISAGAVHSTFSANSEGRYQATGVAHFNRGGDVRIQDNWSCAIMDLQSDGWVKSAGNDDGATASVTMEKDGYRLDMRRSSETVNISVTSEEGFSLRSSNPLARLGVIWEWLSLA